MEDTRTAYARQFYNGELNYKVVQFTKVNKFRVQWRESTNSSWRWVISEDLSIFECNNLDTAKDMMLIVSGGDVTNLHWVQRLPEL